MEETKSPLDRALQRTLLQEMAEEYPGWVTYDPVPDDQQKLAANLSYLAGHELCESGVSVSLSGIISFGRSTITAAGLDFLAEDGGLSAILRVVTVKLHAETIRELIGTKIESAAIPPAERSVLKQHLATLSETALRSATTDLLKRGLDHLPDAIHWLRTLGAL